MKFMTALVPTVTGVLRVPPLQLSVENGASASAPAVSSELPPFIVNMPVTVLAPSRVALLSVKLVMAPP